LITETADSPLETLPERKFLWGILENPTFYRFTQALLAPGAERSVIAEIEPLATSLKRSRHHLDIGSGPSSLLWNFQLQPIGLDPVHACNRSFRDKGGYAVTGSAASLPFADSSFDAIWNFGLLHHLSDGMAREARREMLRVVRPGGYIVVFDGVMPKSLWHNPFVWALRKLDRGRHMRRQDNLESLLAGDPASWTFKRFTYSLWGHEGLLCTGRKQA